MSRSTSGMPADSAFEAPQDEPVSQPAPQPGERRARLLSELADFFAHRRHRRGIFLPLVRIDRSD